MNNYFPYALFFLSIIGQADAANFECPPTKKSNNNPIINIGSNPLVLKKLSPQFFGFNLELIEFQDSLWNNRNNTVENEVINLLRRFPGAVYRYPGGTVSNHFNWQHAIGPANQRTPQKTVDYQNSKIIAFGPIEYLNFIQKIDGTAWYVINTYGSIDSADTPINLAKSAAGLVEFFKKSENVRLPKIYKWELGNELDRGKYRWLPEKYSATVSEIATAVKKAGSDAGFVAMGQDWEHTGARLPGKSYNEYTAKALKDVTPDYSFHLYYDGPPWGPPLPRVVKQLCKNIFDTQLPERTSKFWVTEFGRTPSGTPADSYWKSNWPQTSGLSAAISAADLMISLAPIENLEGAFAHSLHGTSGPWPIFHKRSDGVIYPSAIYWALLILRETLLEDVLTSKITAGDELPESIGYETSTVVMASPNRQKFSMWTAQRGKTSKNMSIVIPQLSGKKVTVKTSTISSTDIDDNNYSTQYKIFPKRSESTIQIDNDGVFTYPVSANSVTATSIEINQK